jgi:hypothetical protein
MLSWKSFSMLLSLETQQYWKASRRNTGLLRHGHGSSVSPETEEAEEGATQLDSDESKKKKKKKNKVHL